MNTAALKTAAILVGLAVYIALIAFLSAKNSVIGVLFAVAPVALLALVMLGKCLYEYFASEDKLPDFTKRKGL